MIALSIWHGDIAVGRPRMSDIAGRIAQRNRLTLDDLRGPSRLKAVVSVRQDAMAACYDEGYWSLPTIGRFFGNRDHSTVLAGIKRAKQRAAIIGTRTTLPHLPGLRLVEDFAA